MDDNEILTLKQAAKLLDTHVRALRAAIKKGQLKANKRLNRYYIFKKDLDSYIKGE